MRTFFAIDLPEAHKNQLRVYIEALRGYLEKAFKPQHFHWVRPENLHVTMQFLGEVKEEDLALLAAQVASSLSEQAPFTVNFGPLEWFPNPNRPRVLSLQVGPQALLAGISRAMGEGIKACGYPIETRSFRGHLTLGRLDGVHHLNPEFLLDLDLPSVEPLLVKEVVFFRSEPERGRAVYTRLAALNLSS